MVASGRADPRNRGQHRHNQRNFHQPAHSRPNREVRRYDRKASDDPAAMIESIESDLAQAHDFDPRSDVRAGPARPQWSPARTAHGVASSGGGGRAVGLASPSRRRRAKRGGREIGRSPALRLGGLGRDRHARSGAHEPGAAVPDHLQRAERSDPHRRRPRRPSRSRQGLDAFPTKARSGSSTCARASSSTTATPSPPTMSSSPTTARRTPRSRSTRGSFPTSPRWSSSATTRSRSS